MSEFVDFVKKQVACCVFPAFLLMSLLATKYYQVPFIQRYDLLLLLALLIQGVLIGIKYETWSEVKVILIFHIVGLVLELFKTAIGSWSYPEQGMTKIWGVPLYSGFMYSSVGSYIYRAWKVFELRFAFWPPKWQVVLICSGIYLNFFTHHFIWDLRYLIIFLVILLFWRTTVAFRLRKKVHRMPLNLSFLLIGIALWSAENIATFFSAWQYPDQQTAWHFVGLGKISSWGLLIILSVALVYYHSQDPDCGQKQ